MYLLKFVKPLFLLLFLFSAEQNYVVKKVRSEVVWQHHFLRKTWLMSLWSQSLVFSHIKYVFKNLALGVLSLWLISTFSINQWATSSLWASIVYIQSMHDNVIFLWNMHISTILQISHCKNVFGHILRNTEISAHAFCPTLLNFLSWKL